MKVLLLASAHADLLALRSYTVKNFSAVVWQITYIKLKTSIQNLATFPYLGGIPPELESLNLTRYRQILSGKNRGIYEVRQEAVYLHLIVEPRVANSRPSLVVLPHQRQYLPCKTSSRNSRKKSKSVPPRWKRPCSCWTVALPCLLLPAIAKK